MSENEMSGEELREELVRRARTLAEMLTDAELEEILERIEAARVKSA